MLCFLTPSMSPLPFPALAKRAKQEDHSLGLQGRSLEFLLLFFQVGVTSLDNRIFISLRHPATQRHDSPNSKVQAV